MGSIDLFDSDLLADDEQGLDEEIDNFATAEPLPDLEDAAVNQEADDPNNVVARLRDLSKKGAAKKRVLRPQPKLDADRLRSSKGLEALPKIFKEIKFKGKGHEDSDLKVIMSTLEHWAHRLYPSMHFSDFIERMEKLGSKKAVQNCVKRIRLDLPINDDLVEEKETEDEPVNNNIEQIEQDEMDVDEIYESIIRDEQNKTQTDRINSSDYSAVRIDTSKSESQLSQSETQPSQSGTQLPQSETQLSKSETAHSQYEIAHSQSEKDNVLSADQLERMRQNRLRALQKRTQKAENSTSLTPNKNNDQIEPS